MNIIARPVIHATQQVNRMIKKNRIYLFLFCLFYSLSGSLFAQDNQTGTCKISYISKENVYVDKGKKSGLLLGDTLDVKRDGEIIANLHLQYVAENSASCLVLNQKQNLHIGDLVEFTVHGAKSAETVCAIAPISRSAQDSYNKEISTRPFARISGGLSLQWFHYEDQTGNNLNFDQPTVGFDLRAKELWGKKYNFVIKMRVRKNQRARNYSTGIEEEEWRNRIYSFYFSYEDNE